MSSSSYTPEELLAEWRAAHWPPVGMRKVGDLPIYIGEHTAVSALSESLAGVLALLSEHIVAAGHGRTPRWMSLPKIEYLVERVNVLTTTAKASRRFTSMEDIEPRCGQLSIIGAARLREWFDLHQEGEVVAHKPFVDLRAYVFCKDVELPKRHRFYQSGLILSAPPYQELLVQDNRHIVRAKRRDRLTDLLATTASGWELYPAAGSRNKALDIGITAPMTHFDLDCQQNDIDKN